VHDEFDQSYKLNKILLIILVLVLLFKLQFNNAPFLAEPSVIVFA